jgi:sugar phosphate isomerase/epimerase
VIRLAVDWRSFRNSVRSGDARDWEAAIRRSAELGAEGILFAADAAPPAWRDNSARLISLARELRLQYAVTLSGPLAVLAAGSRSRRRRATAFSLAKAVGAEVLHLPPASLAPFSWRAGEISVLQSRTARRLAASWLRALCDQASQLNLTVALEEGWGLTTTTVLQLLETTNRPNLRAALAPGGSVAGREDPYRATALLAPHAALAILEDPRGRGRAAAPAPLGEGRVDFAEVFRLLRRAGADVLCAVRTEPPSGRPQDEDLWLERSFVHLTGLREALEREAQA